MCLRNHMIIFLALVYCHSNFNFLYWRKILSCVITFLAILICSVELRTFLFSCDAEVKMTLNCCFLKYIWPNYELFSSGTLKLFSFPMVHYGNHPHVNLKQSILLQWNLICTVGKDYEKHVKAVRKYQTQTWLKLLRKKNKRKRNEIDNRERLNLDFAIEYFVCQHLPSCLPLNQVLVLYQIRKLRWTGKCV